MLGKNINMNKFSDIISIEQLARLIGSDHAPLVLDVRREAVFNTADSVLPAARRAVHTAITAQTLGPAPHGVVVYCVHGHNVSQLATASLRAEGVNAAQLEGGIEAWIAAGHPVIARAPDAAARFGSGTTWVTRRRPKIDRVACPWFIARAFCLWRRIT
jgi:rhodanese-related sulfurtransferase